MDSRAVNSATTICRDITLLFDLLGAHQLIGELRHGRC